MMYDSLIISVSFNIAYLLLLAEYPTVKWLKVIREAGSQLMTVVYIYDNVAIMYVSPNVHLLLMI